MAIIQALNSHSLRLRLGSCRVSLVGGSCGETNTGISVCSSNVGSTLIIMYFCVLCVYFFLAPPIPLGAWAMALALCQRLDNYYFPLKLRKNDLTGIDNTIWHLKLLL